MIPLAALEEAPLKPAWESMPYCTPRPMAPPAGTALEIVNEVWRIMKAGPYRRPGNAAWNGNT